MSVPSSWSVKTNCSSYPPVLFFWATEIVFARVDSPECETLKLASTLSKLSCVMLMYGLRSTGDPVLNADAFIFSILYPFSADI